MYKHFFKRLLDFCAAFFGLFVLSPLFLIVMLGLAIANRGRPFFFQKRPGKDEKIFKVIKFKSMNDKTDARGELLPDAERLTKIGGFVRKTSLDELPQLINVLKGDMSLIGPRPLLVQYLPYYSQREKLRHTIKPGITGWAQIKGRNFLSWDERLTLDVEYVKKVSFSLDVFIIFKTIKDVFTSQNVETIPSRLGTTLDNERKKCKLNN